MAREASVSGVTTGNFAVPGGTYLILRALPFQLGVQFQYGSGGSLSFFGIAPGVSSMTDAQIVAGASNAYLLPLTQVQSYQGPVSIGLYATGTTAVVTVCRTLSAGFSTPTGLGT